MNIADFGPGWWVCLPLPDGRTAIADAEDPANAAVIAAMRRLAAARVKGRSSGETAPGRPRDWAAVTAWMDEREPLPVGQLFVWAEAA